MQEKKIVTWCLVVLFVALMIVYTLMYMRNVEIFTAPVASQTPPTSDLVQGTGTAITTVNMQNNSQTNSDSSSSLGGVTTTYTQTPETESNSDGSDVLASTESVSLLPGTTQFFGSLDIVDVLGVQPNYILQDTRNCYFAYYGTGGLDFVRTVQQLGGNVYTMATESEIMENQLFGDQVSFINLSAFQNKLVLMVIQINGATRLIQVDASRYHNLKPYLRSLFT